jgi:hypothetical protein
VVGVVFQEALSFEIFIHFIWRSFLGQGNRMIVEIV